MAEYPTRRGVIVGGSRFADANTGAVSHTFDLLDLDAPSTTPSRIPLSFLAHGFAPHPRNGAQAAVLEKRGPGGALLDLVSREWLRAIDPLPGHHFYGHGAFTPGASALLTIETDLATKAGLVSVRDPLTFAAIDRFPTYGESPHDCCLVDGGKTLAVTNGGGTLAGATPSVTFVDVATRKLVDKYEVDEEKINTGHVAVVRDREFVVVSAPRDGLGERAAGGVSIRRLGRPFTFIREPNAVTERMVGESLSVCIHEGSRTALTTHPYGNLVTVWNLDHGVIYAAFDLAHARGVTLTLDARQFVVSFGARGGLLAFEAHPFKLASVELPKEGLFSGSHLYTWKRSDGAD